jgi:hypothetical protein
LALAFDHAIAILQEFWLSTNAGWQNGRTMPGENPSADPGEKKMSTSQGQSERNSRGNKNQGNMCGMEMK